MCHLDKYKLRQAENSRWKQSVNIIFVIISLSLALLTYWKAFWPLIVFILATGSRLVQHLLHVRSWSNYLANNSLQFVGLQIAHNTDRGRESCSQPQQANYKVETFSPDVLWTFGKGEFSRATKIKPSEGLSSVIFMWRCVWGVAFQGLPVYSLLMVGGQELLMARPGSGNPWLPYISRRLPDTGSYRVFKFIIPIITKTWRTVWRVQIWRIYRAVHLDSLVHEPENVFAVARLQADDVINDIVHLQSTNLQLSFVLAGVLTLGCTNTDLSLTVGAEGEQSFGAVGGAAAGPGGHAMLRGLAGALARSLSAQAGRQILPDLLPLSLLDVVLGWIFQVRLHLVSSRPSAWHHHCICKHLHGLFRHLVEQGPL